MKTWILIILLAVVTCLIGYTLPTYRSLDFFALLLVFIAAIYVGMALAGGQRRTLIIHSGAALGFVLLTLAGLWYSPLWLVAGYFLHGLWDALHHWRRPGMTMPQWYPPACLVYDWLVGAFVLYMWH